MTPPSPVAAPIAFSPPDLTQHDIDAVVEVLRSGWITTGPVGHEFEAELTALSGTVDTVLTSSATTAMQTALRLLGVGPGDEVITTAYTYSASASVIHHLGATIVLVDTAPGSYVPSVEAIIAAVTPRTRAVIAVDLAGVPFDHPALIEALSRVPFVAASELQEAIGRVAVVADAAHSLGATLDSRPAASWPDLTAFSFHAVKNLTTAEGGALTWRADLPVNAADLRRQTLLWLLHGQSKDALSKMALGAWEYDIEFCGHKANLPDVLAALGRSQMRRYPQLLQRRHEIVERYQSGLDALHLDAVRHDGTRFHSSAHLMITHLGVGVEVRNAVIEQMAASGVATNVHYKPLPMLTAYRALGFDIADFPNADERYRGSLSLPLHTHLSDADVDRVLETLDTALRGVR